VALVAGGLAWLFGAGEAAEVLFAIATALAFVPALVTSVRQLLARRGGVDVIAVLAMAGALLLGEYLAGAIIALMLTGGEALDEHAGGVPIDDLAVGDRAVVKGGEVVPTDGLLLSTRAVLDESALTGESRPVVRSAGEPVPSGVVNAGGALQLRVTAPAASSTYAGIVRLVEQAATERAPFVRMADRYATFFVGITLVTGDGAEVAELVADTVGIDRVLAERAPAEKVDAVREAEMLGRTIMVGDGINDAPALALADAGIAMGARGATAASQAADVVLTADRLAGVADAIRIARRTQRIAWQSVVAGMGLSIVAMGFAAVGLLTPVAGALVQEAIDLAVLVNALRAVRAPRARGPRAAQLVVPAAILSDHHDLRGPLEELVHLADRLDDLPPAAAREQLSRLQRFLVDELLPHELEEERTVYPAVRAANPGEDRTAPMSRSHREIARRVRLLDRTVDELPAEGPDREDVLDLRRSLWGLHAVLDLHLALEDELYAELPTDVGTAITGRSTPEADHRYQRSWT
jgi:iron-sulfur cluster repair protein YtfE (RIC family)